MGIAFGLLFSISFYPFILTSVIWEVSSVRSHVIGTVIRVGGGCFMIFVGMAAWKNRSVKLALLFLGMVIAAIVLFIAVNWRE